MMERIHPLTTHKLTPPRRFTYPFDYEPHPLCRLAAEQVQAYIAGREELRADADHGKMFGVLVVEDIGREREAEGCGRFFFLAAYSGLLAGRNDWNYFVPPVYDAQQPDGYFKTREREISALVTSSDNGRLEGTRLSHDLQLWLFNQYRLLNARGETKPLVDIWQEYYSRPKLRQKFPLPPGGTGDCCAPKLLQYAYQQGLRPVCMAEFWWGTDTTTELRRHLNYYPACRGKCLPLLTWMLQGLDVDPPPVPRTADGQQLRIVYEDDALFVVDKPSGMLSVPGIIGEYSVETVMRERCPDIMMVHRLDMGTSGLLVIAKTAAAYHSLQQQFVRHEVRKKYLALLEPPAANRPPLSDKGQISLPLRPDPMNRPRQVADKEHGKRAVTDYEILEGAGGGMLVALYPQTGRTHQLRIHCAHPEGLGCPIVGDELYGTKGRRLMLHAAELWFSHPVSGDDMHFSSPSTFLVTKY
jgi:tRNA pseudouridine32 synthase/23S rRNA pseudouridine746 synthase